MNLSFFKRRIPQSITWEKVSEEILSAIGEERNGFAVIRPFEREDILTGHKIEVRTNPYYAILSIDSREYYFERETGKFDGTSYQVAD